MSDDDRVVEFALRFAPASLATKLYCCAASDSFTAKCESTSVARALAKCSVADSIELSSSFASSHGTTRPYSCCLISMN